MRFLDVFSGIGGFRAGLEKAGHTCVGHIERDVFARKSYSAIYDIKENEYDRKDITEIEDFTELRGKVDLLCGGFPCQSFSIAGRRKGFDDVRGTMFSILPKFLNKQNHRFYCLRTSRAYYHTTKEKHLKPSSPVWMTWGTTLNGNCLTAKTSEFPKTERECILSDILEEVVDEKYYLSEKQASKLMLMDIQQQSLPNTEEGAEEKHILRIMRRFK